MPSPEWTPPVLMTVLAVDAMYFQAAKEALKGAAAATKDIEMAEMRVTRHRDKIERVNQRHEEGELSDAAHYDKLEPLAIHMENLEYDVGAAYGPFLQHHATVHVFATAALEAHVNIRAQEMLTGRVRDLFERLSLDAKWRSLRDCEVYPALTRGLSHIRVLTVWSGLGTSWFTIG